MLRLQVVLAAEYATGSVPVKSPSGRAENLGTMTLTGAAVCHGTAPTAR
jgi:hypothetical protein